MASPVRQLSLLERLPLEVLKNVLCQFDDLKDMMNAIRACPQIWYAYKEFAVISSQPTKIATCVLLNHLDVHNARGAAIWAHRLSWWPEMAKDVFRNCCQTAFEPADETTKAQAGKGGPSSFEIDAVPITKTGKAEQRGVRCDGCSADGG